MVHVEMSMRRYDFFCFKYFLLFSKRIRALTDRGDAHGTAATTSAGSSRPSASPHAGSRARRKCFLEPFLFFRHNYLLLGLANTCSLQVNCMARPRMCISYYPCPFCAVTVHSRATWTPVPGGSGGTLSLPFCSACAKINTEILGKLYWQLQRGPGNA